MIYLPVGKQRWLNGMDLEQFSSWGERTGSGRKAKRNRAGTEWRSGSLSLQESPVPWSVGKRAGSGAVAGGSGLQLRPRADPRMVKPLAG